MKSRTFVLWSHSLLKSKSPHGESYNFGSIPQYFQFLNWSLVWEIEKNVDEGILIYFNFILILMVF